MKFVIPRVITAIFGVALLVATFLVLFNFKSSTTESWIALGGVVIGYGVLLSGAVYMSALFLSSPRKRKEMRELYAVGKRLSPALVNANKLFIEIEELRQEKEGKKTHRNPVFLANINRRIASKNAQLLKIVYNNSSDLSTAARLQTALRIDK